MKIEGPLPVVSNRDALKKPEKETAGNRLSVKEDQAEKEQNGSGKEDLQKVERAIVLLNKTMESYNTEVRFTLHEKSGEFMVNVVNSKDSSVIREIPPKRVLDMVAHFKEVLGLIVDRLF